MRSAELTLLLAAIQALTRVPVTLDVGAEALRRAVRYFPLVGIGVGLVVAAVGILAARGLPPMVAAMLAVAAGALLTGALHEDGLADCSDGLLGGRTGADALRIMRDSRIGAFGALGLLLGVGVRITCIAALLGGGADAGWAIVAAAAASRFWMVIPAAALPYARAQGMAAAVARPGMTELLVAGAFGLGPLLLLGPRAAAALGVSALVALGLGAYARRRIGGYTGDVLGAVQQLTEIAILLAALWRAG